MVEVDGDARKRAPGLWSDLASFHLIWSDLKVLRRQNVNKDIPLQEAWKSLFEVLTHHHTEDIYFQKISNCPDSFR